MKISFAIVNLILITVAVFFAVNGLYLTISSKGDNVLLDKISGNEASASIIAVNKPFSEYGKIIERNIFNISTERGKADIIDLKALKQTKLNLKLWGTVSGENGGSYAVIEETKTRKQALYRIGDTIQNARVKIILREKVVLSVDGRDEVLQMSDKNIGRNKRVTSGKSEKRSYLGKGFSSATTRTQRISINRSKIDNALGNINELMKQVSIQPHFKNGKPDGLILGRVRPKSFYSEMGLSTGDIIIGVDGQDIESVEDALKFYQNLQTASKVEIQIKRRGRVKNMEYNIK
ncbi:MAG: PDZ domain-containing protein [Desulfobacterales bacterium]|jgi:general secretion pathway protein C|nr:PDZ domain-containing protein [Desulfobacteraceae bacterium]MBT4364929.1 PDZ domain-containing protein [Desulfobacteraceae bacterium]MBT7084558.1 PDZ domain-containing protein [Desulfobacterales bacterium]MBT7697202.1 PDZ domain-containing protein [Desulfobacterales bacterium]